MWIFAGFFKAPLLCLFCLIMHVMDTVDSAQVSAPEVVNALPGRSVTIPCQYDIKFRENIKYWCKGSVYNLCSIVVKTSKNRPSDRSSIVDDKKAGVFTVSIHSFKKSDEGMYWCVISMSGRNFYTGVKLVSHTVTLTLTTPASSSEENDEISWWATLRWILFILMLCCFVSTHITVRRINAAKKISQQQQFHQQISNIYG